MYEHNSLAMTGVAMTLFGQSIGIDWIVLAALGLIVAGIALTRFAQKLGKHNAR